MRANWKVPYVNFYLLRQYLYQDDFLQTVAHIWKASGRIFFALLNKQFRLDRGNSLVNFKTKFSMFNTNLGEYIISKNMGMSIHERKKKKKKKKRKKGVLANPIGYRLDVSGNWRDIWLCSNLSYTEFLHSSLYLRKFILYFFEHKRFWKSGILLNNLKLLNTNKGSLKLYLSWYVGKPRNRRWLKYPNFRRYVLNLVSYYRVWQTRIYWLRYKFSKLEKKYFNKLVKLERMYIIYDFNSKHRRNTSGEVIDLKYLYTNEGRKILSKLIFNKKLGYNKILISIFNDLISKKKRSFEILRKRLQRKERSLLNIGLDEDKIIKTKLSFLRQFFSEITLKKDKYIGLSNLLKNNSFNIWKFILLLTSEKDYKNYIKDFFNNKFSSYSLSKLLLKVKVYLSYKLLSLRKTLVLGSQSLINEKNYDKLKNFIKNILKIYLKYKKGFIRRKFTKKKIKQIMYFIIIKYSLNINRFKKIFRDKNFFKFLVRKIITSKKKGLKKKETLLFILKMYSILRHFMQLQNKLALLDFYDRKLQIILTLSDKYNNQNFDLFGKKRLDSKVAWDVLYIWEKRISAFFLNNIYNTRKKLYNLSIKKNIVGSKSKWSNFLIWFPRFFGSKINLNKWNDRSKTHKYLFWRRAVKRCYLGLAFHYPTYNEDLKRKWKEYADLDQKEIVEKDMPQFMEDLKLSELLALLKNKVIRYKRYSRGRLKFYNRFLRDSARKRKKRFIYYRDSFGKKRRKRIKIKRIPFYRYFKNKLFDWCRQLREKFLFDFYKIIRFSVISENSFFKLLINSHTYDFLIKNPGAYLGPSFFNFSYIINKKLNYVARRRSFRKIHFKRLKKTYYTIKNNYVFKYKNSLIPINFFYDSLSILNTLSNIWQYITGLEEGSYKKNEWRFSIALDRSLWYVFSVEQYWLKPLKHNYLASNIISKLISVRKRNKVPLVYKWSEEDWEIFNLKKNLKFFFMSVFFNILKSNKKKMYFRRRKLLSFSTNAYLFGPKLKRDIYNSNIRKWNAFIRGRRKTKFAIIRQLKLNPRWRKKIYRLKSMRRFTLNKAFALPVKKSWFSFSFKVFSQFSSLEFLKMFCTDYKSQLYFFNKYKSTKLKNAKRLYFGKEIFKFFLNTDINVFIWIFLHNLSLKLKKKQKNLLVFRKELKYLFGFRRRIFSLYFYTRFIDLRGWMSNLFWVKYTLNKNENLKSWLNFYFVTNDHVENLADRWISRGVYMQNRNFLDDFSLDLKRNLYNVSSVKIWLRDLKHWYYKKRQLKKGLRAFNLWDKAHKGSSTFLLKLYLRSAKRIWLDRKVSDKFVRKKLSSDKMRKIFYKMTHENPFKNYAGPKALHKDYGKFIDFSKGRVGNKALVFRHIREMKINLYKFLEAKFLVTDHLITLRTVLDLVDKVRVWDIRMKEFIKNLFKKKMGNYREQGQLISSIIINKMKNIRSIRAPRKYSNLESFQFARKFNLIYKSKKIEDESLYSNLYFSDNVKAFVMWYKIGNENYRRNISSKINCRLITGKGRRVDTNYSNDLSESNLSVLLKSGAKRTEGEEFALKKIIRERWWILKKIKYKFNEIIKLKDLLNNISIKIPLKKNRENLIRVLTGYKLIKNKLFISLKQYREDVTNLKKMKLKKIGIFISKLQGLLLNPELFSGIWRHLNTFEKAFMKSKRILRNNIRRNLVKIRAMRSKLASQKIIDKFRIMFEYIVKRKLEVYIFSIDNKNIGAELLTRYIFIKLRQNYTIGFMLSPLRRELKYLIRRRVLDGFRIRLSGRFNRRQRSKVITVKHGIMPLTEKRKNIDFNERTLVLKFSILSIRVWLCRNDNWKIKKKLQIVSPLRLNKEENIVNKSNIVRYANNFTTYGAYSSINNTKGGLLANSFNVLKKKIVKNDKGFEKFRQNKPVLYERFFNDPTRLYEEVQSWKYLKINFLDASVRSYLKMKTKKKIKQKDRWQIYRELIEKQGSYEKYKLYKVIDNNYPAILV